MQKTLISDHIFVQGMDTLKYYLKLLIECCHFKQEQRKINQGTNFFVVEGLNDIPATMHELLLSFIDTGLFLHNGSAECTLLSMLQVMLQ